MRLRHIPEADQVIPISPFVTHQPETKKGSWQDVFPGKGPIDLEIGMGKGKFLLGMARKFPDRNFIGIERYPSVLYRAVQRLERMEDEEVPKNVTFLCLDASALPDLFSPGEISTIYLNFSDPWPKKRQAKRRLTSPRFRQIYRKVLLPGSHILFKTDNEDLFSYSLEEFKEDPAFDLASVTFDLHGDPVLSRDNVTTEYEDRFAGEGHPILRLDAVLR